METSPCIDTGVIIEDMEYCGDAPDVGAYEYISSSGVSNTIAISNNKKLLKIVDILGKETLYKSNTPLFYIYDDGTVEKRIVIE